MKKHTKFYIIVFSFLVAWLFFVSQTNWIDILRQVFSDINEQNWEVIYLWETSQAVWHALLRQQTAIWNHNWTWWFYPEAPLIVRIAQILLRLTVVLSISMILYNSIKLILQVFKAKSMKSAEAKKDLINVLIWLVLALSSVLIIELLVSASKTIVNAW